MSVSQGNQTCIVVPAYNEEKRLDVRELEAFVAQQEGIDFLFVDDGSTDGTFQLLDSLTRRLPRVSVLRMVKNGGKAEAVRQGLLSALASGYPFVGYWDADWATPLNEIPRFVALLAQRDDIDLMLGSRVALLGRNIDRKWYRHYLGRISATFASIVLGLPVYDTQCGAKLMRNTPALRTIFDAAFRSGWVFDVELIARYMQRFPHKHGIYELPVERWTDVGDSKVRPIDFLRAFGAMAKIYRHYRLHRRYHRAVDLITAPFVRYAGAGSIGTASHYLTVITCVELLKVAPWAASALGATVGDIVNYVLNYHFIFASTRPHSSTLPRFFVVAIMSVVLGAYIVKVGDGWGVHYLASQVVATLVTLVMGYLLNKAWTFRDTDDV